MLFGLTAKVGVERTWAGHQLGPGRQKRPAGVAAAQREHTGVEDARHREVAQTRPRGSAERGWKRAQDMRGDDEIRLIQRLRESVEPLIDEHVRIEVDQAIDTHVLQHMADRERLERAA